MDMISVVTYGQRFKELRKKLGVDQYELAARLFGNRKAQGNVATIEATAGRIPRPETVLQHAEALGCRVSDLLVHVDDTWIDRARRGEFDPAAKSEAKRRPAAARGQ